MEGNSEELSKEQSSHYKSQAPIWNLHGSSQTPPVLAILGLELFKILNEFKGVISVAKVARSRDKANAYTNTSKRWASEGLLFNSQTQKLPFFPLLFKYMTLSTSLHMNHVNSVIGAPNIKVLVQGGGGVGGGKRTMPLKLMIEPITDNVPCSIHLNSFSFESWTRE